MAMRCVSYPDQRLPGRVFVGHHAQSPLKSANQIFNLGSANLNIELF